MSRRAIVLALAAAGGCADALWPQAQGDRFSGTVVDLRTYDCTPGTPDPDVTFCGPGETGTVLMRVDTLRIDLELLDAGVAPAPGPRSSTWVYRGSADFRVSATVRLRRCTTGGCEETGGTTTGLMTRRVHHCPVVISPGVVQIDGVGAVDCRHRPGDTVFVVTVELGNGPSRADWQPLLTGEEDDDGILAGGQDLMLSGRLRIQFTWRLDPA